MMVMGLLGLLHLIHHAVKQPDKVVGILLGVMVIHSLTGAKANGKRIAPILVIPFNRAVDPLNNRL